MLFYIQKHGNSYVTSVTRNSSFLSFIRISNAFDIIILFLLIFDHNLFFLLLTKVGFQTSSPNLRATSGSSVMRTLSKIVPDLTCHKSKPIAQISSLLYNSESGVYSGLSISG